MYKYLLIGVIYISCFTFVGCSLLAKYGGSKTGEAIKGLFWGPQLKSALWDLFKDQPDWNKLQFERECYKIVKKVKGDSKCSYIIIKHFLDIKMKNLLYYQQTGKFYLTQEELYMRIREDEADIDKIDPWGNEYYYEVVGDRDMIIGTRGSNNKWNIKIDATLKNKVKYGAINFYGDDLFIKIRYPRN